MPKRDIRNELELELVAREDVTSDGATNSQIVDGADYDPGLAFGFSVDDYTDGTYTFKIFESDDSGMAGKTEVPAANLNGDISAVSLSAATALPGRYKTIGVHGVKRYLQVETTAASVTTGARVNVVAIKKPEITPASGN